MTIDARREQKLIVKNSMKLLLELPQAVGNPRKADRIERHAWNHLHRLVELERGVCQ